MTHVVLDSCIECKYTTCVEVCPVDCFYEGANMLVIDPDECIDCGVCITECPVRAIVADLDIDYIKDKEQAEKIIHWLNFGKKKIKEDNWPKITKKKDAMKRAEEFKDIENKAEFLIDEPFNDN